MPVIVPASPASVRVGTATRRAARHFTHAHAMVMASLLG